MQHPRSFFRLAWLPLVLVTLLGTGCDDDDDPLGPGEAITGTWEIVSQEGTFYLDIGEDTLVDYSPGFSGCHVSTAFQLEQVDGTQYRLTLEGEQGFIELSLRAEDDELVVSNGFQRLVYERSTTDVSELEECVNLGGGGDPAFTCSELTAVSQGEDISGELTTTDNDTGTRYFDLYGLTLEAASTVDIATQANLPFDSMLFLYDEEGDVIAFNDDATAETRNSRIVATLDPGCYRVEVTTFEEGSTGPYTLSVN